MNFNLRGNLVRQTAEQWRQTLGQRYDQSKQYPNFTGTANVPRKDLKALIEYLNAALLTELRFDAQLKDEVIPIQMSGWSRQTKEGGRYLRMMLTPDFNTKRTAEAALQRSDLADLEAPDLDDEDSQATGGDAEQDDII